MLGNVGAVVLDLCRSAGRELTVVAPFIKESVVVQILENVEKNVTIRCVARWRPEEIKTGVSDLGVWRVLSQRHDGRLLLHQRIHAKYYRADHAYLIGSANLTNRALG